MAFTFDCTQVQASEVRTTDTVLIGNIPYPVLSVDTEDNVTTITFDETFAVVVMADTLAWVLERPTPDVDISDEDTYEMYRDQPELRQTDPSVCVVTSLPDCRERTCELHYMSAPLKLAPGVKMPAMVGVCPVCLAIKDHLPFDLGCTDIFAGMAF